MRHDAPRPPVDHRSLLRLLLFANTAVLLALAYVLATDASLGTPRFAVYGLAWIVVGVVAVRTTRVAPADRTVRRRAGAVAVVYLAALAVAGGLVAPAVGAPATATGARIAWLPPGWGPAPIYAGDLVTVVLMPARVVGYAALAYLVYATVVDALAGGGTGDADGAGGLGGALPGLLGLLSCVSCSWPILASVATGALGAGSGVAGAALAVPYDVSTAVYLLTVGLLYWRPFVR
jgi:hypothetical protein